MRRGRVVSSVEHWMNGTLRVGRPTRTVTLPPALAVRQASALTRVAALKAAARSTVQTREHGG